jgi:hypothetical protein
MESNPRADARDLIIKTSKEIVEAIMNAVDNNYTREVMEQITEYRINQFMREMAAIARTIKISPEQKS